MPALSQSLLQLGSSFLTALTAQRLRQVNGDVAIQQRTLRTLLAKLAVTDYGRDLGLTAGMTCEQFRRTAPLRTSAQFAPFIERMKLGEADVLWPGHCSFFATSSGTTTGEVRHLPVTGDMLRHFRRAGTDSLLYYTARVGHSGVFRGRHLFLGGSSALATLEARPDESSFAGNLSAITTLNLPPWVERLLFEPGIEIARMENSPAKIRAIATRTLGRDITLLAGTPESLLGLTAAVGELAAQGTTRPQGLQAVWPNLECVVHGYAPIGPFADTLRAAAGPTVNFHEVYPSPEGFIAAQDAAPADGLRLMTRAGIFFEFLPVREFDETRLDTLGAKAVTLEDVQPGVDYILILTTPAGLCRCVTDDVVRFISTQPPRLVYVGNTRQQLNAFGEHVTEKELTDSLVTVCRRHNWTITNFHIAPELLGRVTGQLRGHHEWWVELQPLTVQTPTGPAMARELDVELRQRNGNYASRRDRGVITEPVVRLVMPGVFEQWMRGVGRWGGECKMTRCRGDRLIADELARLVRFHTE